MNARHGSLVSAALIFATCAAATPAFANCIRLNEKDGNGWIALTEANIAGDPLRNEYPLFVRHILPVANTVFQQFKSLNFPAPSLCLFKPIRMDAHSSDLGFYSYWRGDLEINVERSGVMRDFVGIDPIGQLESIELVDTLAHEVFHAVQHARAPMDTLATSDGYTWIVEGTATAVGIAFAEKLAGGDRRGLGGYGRYQYDTPLHVPHLFYEDKRARDALSPTPFNPDGLGPKYDPHYHDGTDTAAYRRGHFFYHLGGDLQSPHRVDWLAKYYTAGLYDGLNGLGWLDQVLADAGQEGLAAYYPKFIARHADTLGHFSDEAAKAAPWAIDLVPGQEARRKGAVQPVAATPVSVDLGLKGSEGVYLVTQRLAVNTQGWAHMVIDDQVIAQGENYARLVADGREKWLTRVVNVDRATPWDSRENDYELIVTADPLTFDQGCVTRGSTFEPALHEIAQDLVAKAIASGQMRWDVAGGKAVGAMMLQAPRSGQGRFDIALMQRHKGGWRRYVVGHGVLAAGGCQVRLTIGESLMTYDPQGDYTELREMNQADALYLGPEGRIAMREAGAWVDLPPEMAAMMRGALASRAGVRGGPEVLARGDFEAGPHRLPQELWQEFSWPALREATFGGKRLRREWAPCPNKKSGCTKTRFNPVAGALAGAVMRGVTAEVTFDAGGMPVEVNLGAPDAQGKLIFEVGEFVIDSPPGW